MPPSFPVVVKPRFGSGSRAVVICETWSALQRHLGQALPADEDMLVEEFAAGVEYGMDAAVVGGRLEVILLREKIITPLPYRQAVGYYSVADSDRDALVKERANTMMQAVVEVLGFESCLLHADLLWDGASMFVVEVSARPSGHHLHDLFTPLATGVDPVREFTKFAVPSLGLGYSFQPMATRSLLIRYFDFRDGTVVSVPRLERVREDFPLVKYEEHCLGKHMDRVTDGPTLMQRGYFILEGESRAQLESDSARLLKQFVVEKD
ncbi:MAG: ATP-grasp domain-containing protein [Propionibacteriaceae bacterium]|nr:ATP-grasp domain-containing protein [Propionibacteriaceae bacterium]